MRQVAALAAALALALATAASATTPPRGLVVPGKSLGGLRLGMTKAQVLRLWGPVYGVCRNCDALTWYFTYAKFKPQGAAVEFRRGRVYALWTLWQPPGWHTSHGLGVGEVEARVTAVYGVQVPSPCSGYSARAIARGRTVTWVYLVDDKVWGFGLSRAGAPACR